MATQPLNALIANALALLIWPALALLDSANSGCGDGLCGFFSGILLLGGLGAVTLVFLFRSANRNETPAVLRLTPVLLFAAALAPLMV